jgi:hypothetical protein
MQSLDNRVTNLHLLEQPTPLFRDPDDGLDVALPKTATNPAFEALSSRSRSNF